MVVDVFDFGEDCWNIIKFGGYGGVDLRNEWVELV